MTPLRLQRAILKLVLIVGLAVLIAIGCGWSVTYDGLRVLVLVTAMVLVAAGALLAQSVMRSTRIITEMIQRITQGELSARVPAVAGDEIGALGQAINAMADQLQRRVEELESERNQARAILESMVEGVCALDRDGRLLWLNASAQRLFGVQTPHAEGRRLTELFRQPEVEALIREVLERHAPTSREVQTFTPPEQTIRLQATPCGGGAAGPALVLVAQDVTQMRRLEGMRREFVANVSHELKTPLTSIRGLVETLLNGALDDAANNRRFVTLIDEDATRLAHLIDDLLDLSQIESKAVPLHLQPVDVHALFQEFASRFQRQLTAHRVTLELQIPKDAPRVKGDSERLHQVFLNLLDNAIKFNRPGGRVTVTVERDGGMLRMAVADTGAGIPESDLPRIFERFYRVDKARSRELGGTGLGLAIVKHLVELHGGRVDVRSRLGEGSVFTVILPIVSSGA